MNEQPTDHQSESHSGSHAECSEVLHRIYEYLDGEMQPADVARAVKAAVRRSSSSEHACPDQLRVQIRQRITMVRLELDG